MAPGNPLTWAAAAGAVLAVALAAAANRARGATRVEPPTALRE